MGATKEAGALSEGSGRPFRYVRSGREKEAEGPSARSGHPELEKCPHLFTRPLSKADVQRAEGT